MTITPEELQRFSDIVGEDYIKNMINDEIESRVKETIHNIIYESDELYDKVDRHVHSIVEKVVADNEYNKKIQRAIENMFINEMKGLSVDININMDQMYEYMKPNINLE